MQTAADPQSANRRLGSWKEIAAFFESDESTVRRWERTRGLPIHRVPGSTGAKVFAYTDELTRWLERPQAATSSSGNAVVESAPEKLGWKNPHRTGLVGLAAVCLIALAILLALRSPPSPVSRAPAAHGAANNLQRTPNAEAAAFYRDGLYQWQTRTPTGLSRAIDDFTQAIVHDSGYAEAYAGLANCYNLSREFSTMPPDEAYARAKAAAERAIALDPSLGDAHANLAFVDFYWLRDVSGARREFGRALALAPRSAVAHHWYATFLMTIGEFAAALREIDAAQALDSESTAILADKGLILINSGKVDDAAALLQQLEQSQPAFSSIHTYLSRIHLLLGESAAFLREFGAAAAIRHDPSDEAIAAAGEKGLADGGRAGMLEAMLDMEKRLYGEQKLSAYPVARTYAELGDAADAIAWLKLSLSRHEADNIGIGVDASWAHLRQQANFRSLISQAGLPARS